MFIRFVALNFVVLSALAVGGCAAPTTQQPVLDQTAVAREAELQLELALDAILEDEARIKRVAWPLLVAAADLCKAQGEARVRFDTGASFTSALGFGRELEPALRKKLKIRGDDLVLMHVPAGTPAHSAGLQVGDVLVSINGWAIPTGPQAAAEMAKRAQEWLKTNTPLATTVRRQWVAAQSGGAQVAQPLLVNTVVHPREICNDRVELVPREELNAFATGSAVAIFRGMLRFANDQELAIVIGHELAHNFMGHVSAMNRNQTLGTIADMILARKGVDTQGALTHAAIMKYSRDFEAEADYVGLYVAARAGVQIAQAPTFWRRMAVANPAAISPRGNSATHPASSERFVALERTIAEIARKRADRQALVPNVLGAKP